MAGITVFVEKNYKIGLIKFKKVCSMSGLYARFRAKMFYEKPTTKRRRLRKEAMKKIYHQYKASVINYKIDRNY